MTLKAKIYIALIIVLGAIVAVRGYMLWQPDDLTRFICYLALAGPASGLKVRLPGVTGTMSVLFVFLLAGIVELGLSETLIISSVCVLVQSYWRPKVTPRVFQVVFSIAVLFIASAAADLVYRWAALPSGLESPFRLALLASVFFLTNTLPVAGVIALTENRQLREVWTHFYSWSFPYYLVGAAMVGMFGFVNRTLSWQAWVLILPIVYAIYRCYQLYLDRLENQRRQADDERRHREEVAELLTQSIAANAALRRANEDLEQFAYAASHDLQEPVRMIAIYSELLQRRHLAELSPECQQLLGTMTDGAHRINELIRDLLSYTKTANVDTAVPSTSDPVEVLRDVQQALMERITSLGAVITFENLAPLRVHRTHLLQLLQNLLSNSLKYHSPERQPRIHITSAQAADGMTELMVRDNGIGIDLAYHERIFGVFKRLHSRRVPGTGIGLAICKKIVQHYDGRIWVESGPGEGTTFHLTLPTGAAYGQCTNSGLNAGSSDQQVVIEAGLDASSRSVLPTVVAKKSGQGLACIPSAAA